MMEINADQNLSTDDSSQSTGSESFYSLKHEFEKRKNNEFQNFEQFNIISSYLTSRYDTALGKKEINDVNYRLFKSPREIAAEHNKHDAAKLRYQMEEMKMRRNIRDLENKLNGILSRNQIIPDEVPPRKKREATQEALCIAKNYYSSVWDMNIHIENPMDNKFTCVVNFRFAYGMYPIKFMIDRKTQEVLGWDGSSLLMPEEEQEMKERFSGVDHYFPQVLSELRLLALNKIKLS